ncbi:MAG: chromosomal replication initiator protein DnaA, partial [Deltaproteobacteria bacterium]|nr:chromosomal replication initiator protein DnaA [Deltaproteobacteria bacterium]
MDELWEEALKRLRDQLGKQKFEPWIKPIRVRERRGAEIDLDVPNKFFRDWLLEHFLAPL